MHYKLIVINHKIKQINTLNLMEAKKPVTKP